MVTPKTEKPLDISAQLVKALNDIGVQAEIKGFIHGPRVTRYKIYLHDINQLDKLRRGLERLSLALNLQHARPTLNHGDEAKTISLDVPRPKSTWQTIPFERLCEWVASTPINDDQLIVFPGVDVLGAPYSFDLAAAPHLLVGGTTGSGKSVHLVLATQRPDSKTFSGLIRSNIPARIALTVQKSTESTIILDEPGAEDLLGAGDMLVKAKPGGQPDRVHGINSSRADRESVLRERAARQT